MAIVTWPWARVVPRLDAIVGPKADAVVRSETFAVAAGLAHRARREARQRLERVSRHAWHLLNLPAGSDVNRLLTHIASLERQVRELEKKLESRSELRAARADTAEEGNGNRRRRAPHRATA